MGYRAPKLKVEKICGRWMVLDNDWPISASRTPKRAKFKKLMWWMWLTTGDKQYLTKEM